MKFKVDDRVRSEAFPGFPAGTVIRTRLGYGGYPNSVWVRWDEGYVAHMTEDGLLLDGVEAQAS